MRLSIKLDCGFLVLVDALYIVPTYLGVLEGKPTAAFNEQLIKRCLSDMAPIWGKRKTHLIPPKLDVSDPAHPMLPPVRFSAWLTSFQPIREANAGAELVVVWFGDACSTDSLQKILDDALHALDWKSTAQDFESN